MKKLSSLTLIFAIVSLTFLLLLVFLRIPFPAYPLMSWQDAFDILTSLIIIPIYWLMFKRVSRDTATLTEEIIFMLMAAFWAAGQGLHLSANSINNLIGSLARDQVVDITTTDIYHLTYFYDEILGHYLWHIGVLGLAALLIFRGWRQATDEKTDWRLVGPAGLLYGFTYFCIFMEGNTLPMGFPFAAVVSLLILVWGRKKLIQQPILGFFFVSHLLALLMFIGWGLYWGGFPPIMEALGF